MRVGIFLFQQSTKVKYAKHFRKGNRWSLAVDFRATHQCTYKIYKGNPGTNQDGQWEGCLHFMDVTLAYKAQKSGLRQSSSYTKNNNKKNMKWYF